MQRELLLLGILRKQEMHGYQLAEFIEHNLGSCTDLKKPTAYFLLDKMTAAGWVAYQNTREGRRPMRRVYHITANGEAAYQSLLRQNLAGFDPLYFSGDIGLVFLQDLPASETLVLLEQRLDSARWRLEELNTAPAHPGSTQWLLEHQQRHLAAEIDWIRELIARVSQINSNTPS